MSDEKRQELRVHGVSGTPPHVILYTEPTTDDLGPSHTKVYGTARDPRVEVRAFNWSSLTSGHWSTAFWVLLAPFAFANVAGWMLAKRTKTTIVATRLAALGLTGLFVAQLGVVFLELFGEWVAARGWPDAVALAGMWAEVALFVFLIYRFSVQSHFSTVPGRRRIRLLFAGDDAMIEPESADDVWGDPAADASLGSRSTWLRQSILHRLRRLHLAFGIAVIGAPLALSLGGMALVTLLWPVTLVALVVWTTARPGSSVRGGRSPLISIGIDVALTVYALLRPDDLGPAADLHGFTFTILVVAALLIGSLLFGLAAGGGLSSAGATFAAIALGASFGMTLTFVATEYVRPEESFSDGTRAWMAMLMLGVALTVVLAAAFNMLGFDSTPSENRGMTHLLRAITDNAPRIFRWIGVFGVVATVIATAQVVIGTLTADTAVAAESRLLGGVEAGDLGDVMVITYAMLVGVFLIVGLVHVKFPGLAVAVFLAAVGFGAAAAAGRLPSPEIAGLDFDLNTPAGVAQLTVVVIPALWVLRSIFSGLLDREKRRTGLGVLWDVGSLWPRWFHPLAPPAYGPFVVKDLADRLDAAADDLAGGAGQFATPLVLAAHSQGSVITVCALGQAHSENLDRIALITYGNPIGLLYRKLFPTVGTDDLVGPSPGACGRGSICRDPPTTSAALRWARPWTTNPSQTPVTASVTPNTS